MEVTKEVLHQLYVLEKKTTVEIAKLLGYKSSTSIGNKLKKFGIPTRDSKEAQVNKFLVEKKELFELYVNQARTTQEVAEILSSSAETIRRMLVEYGIPRRSNTENFGGHNKGVPMPDDQRVKLSEIRKEYYKTHTHWNQGNQWAIDVRKRISDTLLDGKDPAPSHYGNDWRLQRTSCLQRDDYTCQSCGEIENLEVHHWTPYRFSLDNSLDNLVTLCFDCHRETHKAYINEGFIKEAEGEHYANV